jgi:hypothetical protein
VKLSEYPMYYASLSYKCEYIKKFNTNRRKIFIKKKNRRKIVHLRKNPYIQCTTALPFHMNNILRRLTQIEEEIIDLRKY